MKQARKSTSWDILATFFVFPGRIPIALMLFVEQTACFSAAENNRLEQALYS